MRCAGYLSTDHKSPLVSLPPQNQVLHNFWKRYLQKSKQAYCENPVHARKRKAAVSDRQSLGQGHSGRRRGEDGSASGVYDGEELSSWKLLQFNLKFLCSNFMLFCDRSWAVRVTRTGRASLHC